MINFLCKICMIAALLIFFGVIAFQAHSLYLAKQFSFMFVLIAFDLAIFGYALFLFEEL